MLVRQIKICKGKLIEMADYVNIAIDGPAGAGKSTIAKAVAAKKKYIYLDTGAMYRAYGLYMAKCGFVPGSVSDDEFSKAVCKYLDGFNLRIDYLDDGQHVYVNGEDYTMLIRTPEVSAYASKVASIPELRVNLVDLQREIAGCNNVVVDGRDIGSHVLPNANVKIFLTASAEERAMRRYKELLASGREVSYEDVYKDMVKRDLDDTTREFSPLVCAEDAIVVDSTKLSLEESIDRIVEISEAKI